MGTLIEVMATDGTEKGVLMLNLALTPMLTMDTGPGTVTDILITVTDMAIIWANEVLTLMPNLMPMATIPAIMDIPIVTAMAVTMAVTGAKLTDHFSLLTLILITLISEHKKIFCLLPWLTDHFS